LAVDSRKLIVINKDWCTGCGICAAFCPVKVLEVKLEKVVIAKADACIKCGFCELRCPDYAIHLSEEEK
jgi:2-oxoglutarate ferredoxin oxidoreductase subunit delta